MSNKEDDTLDDSQELDRYHSTRTIEDLDFPGVCSSGLPSGGNSTDEEDKAEEGDTLTDLPFGSSSEIHLPQDQPEHDKEELAESSSTTEENKKPDEPETSPMRPNLSQSMASAVDPTKSIRVGTFKINGEVKHYAVVPPLLINSQPDLKRVMDYWGVPRPNFLLQANESNKYRDYIITEENAPYILEKVFQEDKAPVFKRTQAKRNVKMSVMGMSLTRPWGKSHSAGQDDTEGTDSPAADSENEWRWVNRYLERCCIQALSSIVAAADMTCGFILCHGSPGSNEKLLEGAMDSTGAAPYVIVVDDLDRYAVTPEHKALVDQMLDSATCIPIYEAEQGHYVPAWEDIDFEFEDSFDVLYRRGSYPMIDSGKTSLWHRTPEMKWKAAFPWKKGTHFIFSEKFADFQPRVMGPAGYLCIHGCNEDYEANPKRTGYMIREAILSVKPCILFDHTGAETQMYARLIREIQKRDKDMILGRRGQMKRQPTRRVSVFAEVIESMPQGKSSSGDHYKNLKMQLRRQAASLRDIANQGQTSGEAIAVNLGLADVVQIVDLYCANPRLFTKIIVTVDPFNESPEDIVKKLTLSFARALSESREVGAGDADKHAVEQAWRFHYQLDISKMKKRFWRDSLYYAYIIAGFATTLTVVCDAAVAEKTKPKTQWLTLSFALITSLCMAILNLTGADSQLQRIQTAQAKIEYEIMRFRMRVGKYSLGADKTESEDETESDGVPKASAAPKQRRIQRATDATTKVAPRSNNLSKAMHESRQAFSQSMATIMQDLASLDLYFDEGARHEVSSSEQGEFKCYVKKKLYISVTDDDTIQDAAVSGLMTPEDYYELRLLPLLEKVEQREDKLRLVTRGLQISSLVCSAVATILSAAAVIFPIPAVIAGGTGLFQLLKVNDYERRFEVVSSAARELRAIDSGWESLSDLDRQMRSSLVQMVKTTEQLALQYATNSVIQVDKEAIGMDKRSVQQQVQSLSFGVDNV